MPVRFAVLTVSDTRSLEEDRSGTTLQERIEGAGHILADRAICTDDRRKIRAIVKRWIADPEVDVVITTGGTGFTGRDVTPEAIEPLFEKRMEGFSAIFHRISYEFDRHLDHPVAGDGGACRQYLRVLPAGLARRLPRRLGRNPCQAVRLSSGPVQLRRDHAAARRAPEADEVDRRRRSGGKNRHDLALPTRAPAGRSPVRGRGRR